MAYVDQTARRPSLRIGLAVGLLHLGVGAALLTTFAGGAITAVIHHTLQGNNWTYVPPPPPKPAPTPERKPPPTAPTHIDTTPPVIDKLAPANPLPQTGPSTLPQIDDGPVVIRPTEPFFPPPPEPQPQATPQRATPKGNPGDWVTRNDYPGQAVREGWTGVTRFRLTIGRDGRVADCAITASSGHDLLDATACARIASRARFAVATDASGAATTGIYLGSIRWELDE